METETEGETNVLDEAKKLLEDLKKANEEGKELIKRREEIAAIDLVSGRASAGETHFILKETDDEKWAREAKIRYAGTGFDPT